MYPTSTQLVQVSLDNTVFNPTPLAVQGLMAPSSADVDIVENIIYWANTLEGKIYKSPVSGGTRAVAVSLDLINPEVLAIDSFGRKLYWSDTGRKVIEVSGLDGSHRKVLISDNIYQINSLTLDIQERQARVEVCKYITLYFSFHLNNFSTSFKYCTCIFDDPCPDILI